ncbi:hypothetical protein [Hallella mizrahii]|uniref:Lipoprotein n=1 Tax=Hallella mizrahii TaxID=2606637 RepID=A0A7K0KI74_9BACT|nr:hypothetical protein [Hallella mizrahii]MST85643.1 hypothetical protein [Hallella mizrahii]
MELKFLGSLLCAIVLLCGCTDTVEDVNSSLKVQKAQVPLTRAVPDSSTLDDNPKEFTVSEETKRMKELYTQLHSQHRQAPAVPDYSYDDTFWGNMFAIRELPATINVRATSTSGSTNGYVYLYCAGKGKEVVLNGSNDPIKNRFYIKVLPASTGIPYLIYSEASGTPLSVGYYTKKADEKILMAAKEENISLASTGWDLLRTNSNKKYYAIQSENYLGQSDPNNSWSIFYYVLEAVSGNKIRYAKRIANKAQQEFMITPDTKFDIISLEYDVVSPSISKSTFSKTVTVKNTSSQQKNINVPFDFYEIENSFFNRSSWNVNLNFSNPGIKFERPSVIRGNVVSPETDSPKDALFLSNGYQNINRHITYTHPIRCKASSVAKVTLKFIKYNITVKYTAKAQCTIDGNVRECILKGTWSGSVIEDPTEVKPEETIIYSPLDSDGDIILKRTSSSR